MLTIEQEFDCTVVTTLDETASYEDVEVVLDEVTVFISQYIEDTDKKQVLEMSYQQFVDILMSLDLPDGAYYTSPKRTKS